MNDKHINIYVNQKLVMSESGLFSESTDNNWNVDTFLDKTEELLCSMKSKHMIKEFVIEYTEFRKG